MKHSEASLIVGADGLIGRALSEYLALHGTPVYETTRRPKAVSERRWFLDLSQDVTTWTPPHQIAVAYLCAAVSSQEQCHNDPVRTALVNVTNMIHLAKTLTMSGTFVIFLSTNLVYDGSRPFRKVEEPVCPTTEYGRQKALTEKTLLTLGTMAAVVRLTKVISSRMPLFTGWIQALKTHQTIHPFTDLLVAPISLTFTADVLGRIGERRMSGIVQVSGENDVSYAHIAALLAQRLEVPPTLVQPIHSRQSHRLLETTPLHTTLDTTRLREECAIEPPDIGSTIDSGFEL